MRSLGAVQIALDQPQKMMGTEKHGFHSLFTGNNLLGSSVDFALALESILSYHGFCLPNNDNARFSNGDSWCISGRHQRGCTRRDQWSDSGADQIYLLLSIVHWVYKPTTNKHNWGAMMIEGLPKWHTPVFPTWTSLGTGFIQQTGSSYEGTEDETKIGPWGFLSPFRQKIM